MGPHIITLSVIGGELQNPRYYAVGVPMFKIGQWVYPAGLVQTLPRRILKIYDTIIHVLVYNWDGTPADTQSYTLSELKPLNNRYDVNQTVLLKTGELHTTGTPCLRMHQVIYAKGPARVSEIDILCLWCS